MNKQRLIIMVLIVSMGFGSAAFGMVGSLVSALSPTRVVQRLETDRTNGRPVERTWIREILQTILPRIGGDRYSDKRLTGVPMGRWTFLSRFESESINSFK